jgi:tetratricopeptide (TPR) repeat protein
MASSQDRKDLALDFFPRALKAAESLDPPDKKRLRNALVHVGNFYSENERAEESIALLSRAADLSKVSDDPVLYAIDLDNIGVAYARLKRHEDAVSFHRSALSAIDAATTGSYRVRTKGVILFNLAYAHYDSGDMVAAESGYRQSLAALESAPAEVEPWRVRTVKKSYAQLLEKLGRNEEAAALLATVSSSPRTQ